MRFYISFLITGNSYYLLKLRKVKQMGFFKNKNVMFTFNSPYRLDLPICMMLGGRVLSIVRSTQTDKETGQGRTDCFKCKLALLDFQETHFLPFIKFKVATAVPF